MGSEVGGDMNDPEWYMEGSGEEYQEPADDPNMGMDFFYDPCGNGYYDNVMDPTIDIGSMLDLENTLIPMTAADNSTA